MVQTLQFNSDQMFEDLTEVIVGVMNSLINEMYRTAIAPLSADGKADSEVEEAVYDRAKQLITAKCVFYANAIVESFGMGTGADASQKSYWDEYKESIFWNPARTGKPIVGRPADSPGNPHINVWGYPEFSKGTMVGKRINLAKDKKALRSIQTMEAWINKDGETKIERALETAISKFFAENASKYFIEIGG